MVLSPALPPGRPRTRSPLGEGPVTPRIPEEVALSQTAGAPGPPRESRTPAGSGPHMLSEPLSREGTDTPPRGVRSRHVSAGAGTRAAAKLPLEDLPTYRIQCGRRLVRSAAVEPEETFARLYCWSCVTKVHSTAAGATYATRVSLLRQLDTTTRRRSIITATR